MSGAAPGSLEHELRRIRVVLVEPTYSGNLGQVARAMRNFGLTSLWLAGGRADPDADEARWYAREEGGLVLDRARRVDSFDEAVRGCRTVIGTSRRLGRRRGPAHPPEVLWRALAPWARPWETALVFGREAHGLSTPELDRCTDLLWVPTDPACPSLNLAHAVAVVGYTLASAARDALGRTPEVAIAEPAPHEEVQAMFDHARRVWLRIGYLHYQNPDAILRHWRKIFGRARLTEHEVRIVRALLHQTDWVAGRAGLPEGGAREAPELFDKHAPPEADD
ncbi:MAG: tRNA (cytosine(32)/uridine(32)-2'-O)-methyltransferase TrmJ [Acidobacteriota bacterium]